MEWAIIYINALDLVNVLNSVNVFIYGGVLVSFALWLILQRTALGLFFSPFS